MFFVSFFKTLEGKEVIVELKNGLELRGTLHSVDQYLNFKLDNMSVVDKERYPQMVCARVLGAVCDQSDLKISQLSVKNCFIRGSVVRQVQVPKEDVDVELLQDAARKEAAKEK